MGLPAFIDSNDRFVGVKAVGRSVSFTQMQSLWLPTIQAQLALDKKNSAAALKALQAASPIEFGNFTFGNNISCLYHGYIRGEAYLAAGQGTAAAAEFQTILDHSGIVWNCWTGAIGASGNGSCQRFTSENFAGSGCRCRPRSGARRLQRFPHPLEKRRPRYSHSPRRAVRIRKTLIAIA